MARLDRNRLWELVGLALVLAGAIVLWGGATTGYFVQDDYGWLESTRFASFREYASSFFRFNPALSYRPLSQETFFWLGQKTFGLRPLGFHLVSLTFHLAGSILVYLILRRFVSPLPGLVGMLFYVAHDAHMWAVYWISAIPELMAAAFYAAAVLAFIEFDRTGRRGFYAASLAAMALGLMSKESILTLPLVLAAYCVLLARRRLLQTAPFFAGSALYAVLRATSSAVGAAPYPLTLGRGALRNLLTYLSWATGVSETFLRYKMHWNIDDTRYLWTAALFAAGAVLALLLSSDRRVSLFALAWFAVALQPVLYFSGHIFPYYLAPALQGLSLLVALALPGLRRAADLRAWIPALVFCYAFVWVSQASVRRDGRWWINRADWGRSFVRQMPAVDRAVPGDGIAYIFGLDDDQRGVLQEDAAFKAFGFSTRKFILMGVDSRTPGQIRHLHSSGELGGYYCYLYSAGRFNDWTAEFRADAEAFLLLGEGFISRPQVRVEVEPSQLTVGRDHLTLRVVNLGAAAIDLMYSIDGVLQPAVRGWRLEPDGTQTVPINAATRRGIYEYLAVRDAAAPPDNWIRVQAVATVE